MLFWTGGGDIGAAAVAVALVVSGAVGNQMLPLFPAGIMSEFLEFL